ncbi:MAG: hypothetical protein HY898_11050 [Deltaproteobacteria bacterium]|nr:hypothetical protein [Deltaproteobacteria bacterium]
MAQNPPPPPAGGGYPPPPPAGGGYPPPPPAGGGYPPAPGGGGYPAAAPVDPYAADRALEQWAQGRGYALNTSPDIRWYQGWYPCIYAYQIHRVGRELRAAAGDAGLWLVEAFEDDPIKRATGEDRHLCAFLTSPKFVARAAVRSKSGGSGVIDEIGHGIGSLFASKPAGGMLGDPTFESRFDVTIPSRQEGDAALPMALRQLLLQSNWRGIIEVRPGGLILIPFGQGQFEPQTLDALLGLLGQILRI